MRELERIEGKRQRLMERDEKVEKDGGEQTEGDGKEWASWEGQRKAGREREKGMGKLGRVEESKKRVMERDGTTGKGRRQQAEEERKRRGSYERLADKV